MSRYIRPIVFAAAATLLLAAGGVAAQQGQMPMQHGSGHSTGTADTPSTKAYKAADAKMHKAMMIKYTGDADKDFVAGMIAHHQGAIDMAKVLQQYGKDPELKKLADDI